MDVTRRKDGWWIVNVHPYYADGELTTACGPYKTKADALSDLRGLKRAKWWTGDLDDQEQQKVAVAQKQLF